MLKHLNDVNDVKIYSVFDKEFESFGNIVKGYDFSQLISYMENETEIPNTEGNVYYPSIEAMEQTAVSKQIGTELYGNMPIQIGYCNGRNTTYNGFEYHKCSEINIAITDFVLVLGHTWQIEDNKFTVGNEKLFFVPKGTAIEMYQTTLHLSPCRVNDEGFKDIVILAKGTNTPLDAKPSNTDGENQLLLQKNKWVIAHKDRKPLIKQGAYAGLIGENKRINY